VLQPPSDERVFSAGESVTLAWSAEHATALRANGPRAEG
jgi:hypothetical protein